MTTTAELNTQLQELRNTIPADQYQEAALQIIKAYISANATKIGKNPQEVLGGVESLTSVIDQPTDLIVQAATALLTKDLKAVKLPEFDQIELPGGANLSSTLETMLGGKVEGGFAHNLITNGSPQSILSSIPEVSNKLGAFDNPAQIFGDAILDLASSDPTRYNSFLSFVKDVETEIDNTKDLDIVKDLSSLVDPIDAVAASKEAAKGFLDNLGQEYDPLRDNASGSVDPLIKGLLNKLNGQTGLEVFDPNQFSLGTQLGGLGLFGSVDELLSNIENKGEALSQYFKLTSQYSDDVLASKDRGLTGILQNIVESNDGNIEGTINSIAGGSMPVEDKEKATSLLVSGDNDAAADLIVKSNPGLTKTQALDLLSKINTTLSGTIVVRASEALPPPYIVGQNLNEWSGEATDYEFTYVSTVEELEAEFFSCSREITETIVHWTDTYTNKNVNAQQIHDTQNQLYEKSGLAKDGIAYHYIIRRDGSLQRGRPIDLIGQHSTTNDHDNFSIGIAFVGGFNCPSGTEEPERFRSARSLTIAQFKTFDLFCRSFYKMYPGGQILGHNDIDPDQFDPGFDVIDYCQRRYNKSSSFEDPASERPLSSTELSKERRIGIALARVNEFNAFPFEAGDINPPDSISNVPSELGTRSFRTEDDDLLLPGTQEPRPEIPPQDGPSDFDFGTLGVDKGSFDLSKLTTLSAAGSLIFPVSNRSRGSYMTFTTTSSASGSAAGYAGWFSFEIPDEFKDKPSDVSFSLYNEKGKKLQTVTTTPTERSPKLYWKQVDAADGESVARSDGTVSIIEGNRRYAVFANIVSSELGFGPEASLDISYDLIVTGWTNNYVTGYVPEYEPPVPDVTDFNPDGGGLTFGGGSIAPSLGSTTPDNNRDTD